MIQEIKLKDQSVKHMIARTLGVTPQAIGQALRFKRNSKMAIQAREMALQNGGILMKEADRVEKVKILNAKGETEKVITVQT